MTIRTVLKDLNANYIKSLNGGDAEGCADNYAEDGTFLFRGGSVRGRANILALHEHFIDSGIKMVSLEPLEFQAFGDLGYALQIYATEQETGRILQVLKRQMDDSWKVQAQSVTSV